MMQQTQNVPLNMTQTLVEIIAPPKNDGEGSCVKSMISRWERRTPTSVIYQHDGILTDSGHTAHFMKQKGKIRLVTNLNIFRQLKSTTANTSYWQTLTTGITYPAITKIVDGRYILITKADETVMNLTKSERDDVEQKYNKTKLQLEIKRFIRPIATQSKRLNVNRK